MCSVDYSWVLCCVFANSCWFAVVLFLRAKRCHTTALKVYKVFTSFVVSHHIHLSVFPGVSECTWWNKASRLVTFISLLVMFRNQAPHILLWETTCPLVSRFLLVWTDPLKSRSSNFGRNHNDRRWLRHNKCTFTIWGFLCHHVTCSGVSERSADSSLPSARDRATTSPRCVYSRGKCVSYSDNVPSLLFAGLHTPLNIADMQTLTCSHLSGCHLSPAAFALSEGNITPLASVSRLNSIRFRWTNAGK